MLEDALAHKTQQKFSARFELLKDSIVKSLGLTKTKVKEVSLDANKGMITVIPNEKYIFEATRKEELPREKTSLGIESKFELGKIVFTGIEFAIELKEIERIKLINLVELFTSGKVITSETGPINIEKRHASQINVDPLFTKLDSQNGILNLLGLEKNSIVRSISAKKHESNAGSEITILLNSNYCFANQSDKNTVFGIEITEGKIVLTSKWINQY